MDGVRMQMQVQVQAPLPATRRCRYCSPPGAPRPPPPPLLQAALPQALHRACNAACSDFFGRAGRRRAVLRAPSRVFLVDAPPP